MNNSDILVQDERMSKKGGKGSSKWISTAASSGTLPDKVAALALQVQVRFPSFVAVLSNLSILSC